MHRVRLGYLLHLFGPWKFSTCWGSQDISSYMPQNLNLKPPKHPMFLGWQRAKGVACSHRGAPCSTCSGNDLRIMGFPDL
jgi:hypothetical protein